jgi:predicted NAD/FAD-binding protein
MSNEVHIMKVGIIGGGAAGLTAAWLLDRECEVILFEKEARLGGHAYTVHVPHRGSTVPIEIGFEFFNAWLFPTFTHLLQTLNVPVMPFPLTYCFYTPEHLLVLSSEHTSRLLQQLLKPDVATFLQFKMFIAQGEEFIKKHNVVMTIEQFANTLWLTNEFKNNFLYPFLVAMWGCKLEEFKLFAAYDVLSWICHKKVTIKPQRWLEIVGGISAYIDALVSQLEKTSVKLKTSVHSITYDGHAYSLTDDTGTCTRVDHLIFATNPQQAARFVQTLPHLNERYRQLSLFESFPATVAVHDDERFMPKDKRDWSVANVCYERGRSAMTVYKHWKLDPQKPIFRSWLPHEDYMPRNIFALERFEHQKVTPAYFKAQEILKSLQGNNNVWLVGLYMDDLDSHESAVASALKVARKIVPHGTRAAQFNKIISS